MKKILSKVLVLFLSLALSTTASAGLTCRAGGIWQSLDTDYGPELINLNRSTGTFTVGQTKLRSDNCAIWNVLVTYSCLGISSGAPNETNRTLAYAYRICSAV